MLILARRAGEAIAIGDGIMVRILEIKNGQVKVGIEAPAAVAVHREEIYRRIVDENRKAAHQAPEDLVSLPSIFRKGEAS